MSVRPLAPIGNPVQWDLADGYLDLIKGGEVVVLTSVLLAGDEAAPDVLDGYLENGTKRTVATLDLSGARATSGSLFYLVDDGKAGYGPSSYLGGTTGQVAATAYSPTSAYASGKVSCWKSGLFAVSTDAVATDLKPAAGQSLVPGTAIYATDGGILTASSSTGFKVGYFVEYSTDSSWVSTPAYSNGLKVPVEIIIHFG